ncbi:MAG: SMP-30/gluconolactonase/LRE family protein [Candidatus Hydrogenedentes bacterium]|nr:SMP-30/gluconolactonase/LRE family protein [Candidatus Hydrogenedentota bacterium]
MKKATRIASVLLTIFLLSVAYLLFWPVEIDPVPWTPPVPPALDGAFAANNALDDIERLLPGYGAGPEDIAKSIHGQLYIGYEDGRIVCANPDGSNPETFANTGGRPLGMAWDIDDNLIVADAHKGLLSINPHGAVRVLSTEEGSIPFGFTDDVDVAQDGTIYFTDASWKFHAPNYMADLMEHRGNGRFLSYDPKTGKTTKLIGDLCFANGVAISKDQSFVLINETWKYRVLRYWLTGEKKGTWDVFVDNLPGFPDNLSTSPDGGFWVAIANQRDPLADGMLPYPILRKMLWRLPKAFIPAIKRYGMVIKLDASGNVVQTLQSPSGVYAPITSVNEYDGALYFGSIVEDAVGKLVLKAQ